MESYLGRPLQTGLIRRADSATTGIGTRGVSWLHRERAFAAPNSCEIARRTPNIKNAEFEKFVMRHVQNSRYVVDRLVACSRALTVGGVRNPV
jgi:hypothetical protein